MAASTPFASDLRIRPGESTDHRGPNLFRRHDITQTDFITPAAGVAEPSDSVVRFTGLSEVREQLRILLFALIHESQPDGNRPLLDSGGSIRAKAIPKSNGRRWQTGALLCYAVPSGKEHHQTSTYFRS